MLEFAQKITLRMRRLHMLYAKLEEEHGLARPPSDSVLLGQLHHLQACSFHLQPRNKGCGREGATVQQSQGCQG